MKTTHYPSVKGMIGDWTYYVTVMRVSDIVLYVQFAEQVCPNQDLDMMIQREVSARSKQIAEYLRTQDQRFFGSLIVAVYDGEPKFLPISFSDAPLLNQLEGKLGILQFDGSEQYYVVDGQHRLAALREVVG
jgi:DNA sulfur modification protein DndB